MNILTYTRFKINDLKSDLQIIALIEDIRQRESHWDELDIVNFLYAIARESRGG